jgi:hypothetical protein
VGGSKGDAAIKLLHAAGDGGRSMSKLSGELQSDDMVAELMDDVVIAGDCGLLMY